MAADSAAVGMIGASGSSDSECRDGGRRARRRRTPRRDAQRAHLPARPARRRRRRRHERLHRRDRQAAGRRAASRSRSSPARRPATCRRSSRWHPASWCGTSPPARSRAWPRTTCPPSCAPSPPACCAPRRIHEPGWYDVVHSHYWLSGQVGWLARDRWGVPLVHSAHTLAKVKNALLAEGDGPEPRARVIGEEQVVAEADRLIASTDEEADAAGRALRRRPGRGAAPSRPASTSTSSPRATAPPRGAALGLRRATLRRCCSSAASSRSRRPTCCCARPPGCAATGAADRLQVVVRRRARAAPGWPTRAGCRAGRRPRHRATSSASSRRPPASRVADYYRAADLTVVPSYNESFGLVALESQACGTPVVAAAVGGLPTAVRRRRLRRARRRARPRAVGEGASAICCARRADLAPAAPARRARTPSGSPGTARPTDSLHAYAKRSTTAPARRPAAATMIAADVIEPTLERARVRARLDADRVRRRAAGREAAQDGVLADRRRARARGRGVRHAQAGREPRAASTPSCCSATRGCTAVSWSIDSIGDVYLTGRLPLVAVTPDEIDRVLGSRARLRRRHRSTPCSSSASARRSGASGPGG